MNFDFEISRVDCPFFYFVIYFIDRFYFISVFPEGENASIEKST